MCAERAAACQCCAPTAPRARHTGCRRDGRAGHHHITLRLWPSSLAPAPGQHRASLLEPAPLTCALTLPPLRLSGGFLIAHSKVYCNY